MQALWFNRLLIVWLACVTAIYRFNKLFRLMTCGSHCLLAEMIESVRRHVACALIIMTKVKEFHCVALIEVRCNVTFSHLIESITFVDVFFDWLVLLNAVNMYLRCRDVCVISLYM